MQSVKTLYKIGYGPSSSHTMGPGFAAERFASDIPAARSYRVTLYGSLAATGKGHLTDVSLKRSFSPKPVDIFWEPGVVMSRHPNAMKLEAVGDSGSVISEKTAYSIGGGEIVWEGGRDVKEPELIYDLNTMDGILSYVSKGRLSLWNYVYRNEGRDIKDYFGNIWIAMQNTVVSGLNSDGILPGELGLNRKAGDYFARSFGLGRPHSEKAQVFSFALACAEQNASGGKVVTAPTCGSSGVLPAVLYYFKYSKKLSDRMIINALATAGLVGNLARTNASISGAEVGCQGEIGVACAMAAGAAAQIMGGTPAQIETAAEMAIEHHLGLTCDPVCGLVQIPCIERNAVAAGTALDLATLAMLSDGRHRVSFDKALETMLETGKDMKSKYRETATGGLAEHF